MLEKIGTNCQWIIEVVERIILTNDIEKLLFNVLFARYRRWRHQSLSIVTKARRRCLDPK